MILSQQHIHTHTEGFELVVLTRNIWSDGYLSPTNKKVYSSNERLYDCLLNVFLAETFGPTKSRLVSGFSN